VLSAGRVRVEEAETESPTATVAGDAGENDELGAATTASAGIGARVDKTSDAIAAMPTVYLRIIPSFIDISEFHRNPS
jgi:hypothetical protein